MKNDVKFRGTMLVLLLSIFTSCENEITVPAQDDDKANLLTVHRPFTVLTL